MGDTRSVEAQGAANVLIQPRADLVDLPKPARRLGEALAGLGEAMRQPLNDFVATMTQASAHKPSEVEVKFGLVFEGGTDWKVVSFSAEANLDITVTWKA